MSKPIIFKLQSEFADFIERNGLNVITSEAELFQVLNRTPGNEGVWFVLNDCITCTVTEERNGAFEMVLQYPVTGRHFEEVELMAIIAAKPSPFSTVQYFRVNRITRPIDGVITVYAVHISYDLSGIPVSPYTATTCAMALTGIKSNAAVTCPFDFWTDKETTANFSANVPTSGRALLGGQNGSVLDVYGGEFEFNNYTVKLHAARGEDRGVTIRYGKNLTSLEQDANCAAVYTGVYPYWANEEELVELPEKVINADGTYTFTRVRPLDLSQEWETAPAAEQLRSKAAAYMQANNIGVPKVSLKVGFIELSKTEEYKDQAIIEQISLCDVVTVSFEKLGVNATAKCIKTAYNVLLDRYDTIELGDAKSTLAQTIADTSFLASQAVTGGVMAQAINRATQAITGNLGGYVVVHDSDGNGTPDEILIMDTPNIDTAQKVWRWNNGGLGYSGNGYAGPYDTAITQNGEIVADFITTGLLSANLIKSGTITNDLGNLYINVDSGVIRSNDTVYNIGNYTQYSGVSMVQRIKMTDGREIDVTHVGVNPSNTGGQVYVSDKNKNGLVAGMYDKENGTGVLFAFGKDGKAVTIDGEAGTVTATGAIVGSNIDSGGLHYNGRYYYPMDIDFKDGRGATQVMHILCAGLN